MISSLRPLLSSRVQAQLPQVILQSASSLAVSAHLINGVRTLGRDVLCKTVS